MIDADFQQLINIRLHDFFSQKTAAVKNWDPRLTKLIGQIQDLTLRQGDRLRPFMCSLGYQVLGLRQLEPIMPVLLSLELFHSYALIHDDIMDQAQERRGKLTINAYFTQNLRKDHLASSLSLLSGDLCAGWAHELLHQLPQNEAGSQLKEIFSRMEEDVMWGQVLDAWGMQEKTEEELIRMYEAKSGSYSIQKPLLMGAILGDAKNTELAILSDFGRLAGLAFQLQDDLLGVFGSTIKTGKSNTADIIQGKWTFLIAFTWEKLLLRERGRLRQILGISEAASEDVEWVKEQIITTGAKMKVETWSRRLIDEAKLLIAKSSWANQQEFVNLADFIINRTF